MIKSLGRAFRVLTAPCREMSLLISRSIDEDLPTLERIAIRLHCCYCRACRRFRKQVAWLRQTLSAHMEDVLDGTPESPGLSAEARARIAGSLPPE